MSASTLDPDRTLDDLPGFRRRFRITPLADRVCSEVEDDYHCMSVILHHDGRVVTAAEAEMQRAPWNTCPGATTKLKETFTGVALDAFVQRGEKRSNCTHLHDLALLGAAHARDADPLIYDILVSDPVAGRREAELRRNGEPAMRWAMQGNQLVQPAELAGLTLDNLGPWIATLDAAGQEAARVLRWGTFIAHGRSIPLDRQFDAAQMPVGNCYTFQPDVMVKAQRVGEIRDFSTGKAQPLAERCAISYK